MAKNILWIYGHHEHSGYARNSREFIKALNHNGVTTKFLNIGDLKDYPEIETMKQFEAEPGYKFDLVIHNVVPTSFQRVGKNVPNILMTVAETDSIEQHWVKACNKADEVWTMSYYSKAAFVTSGVTVPIRTTLMPIDIASINSRSRQYITLPQDKYYFFANSEWTPRKGWDILLKAFYKTFKSYEDVALVIKTCCFSPVESIASVKTMIASHSREHNAQCKSVLIYDVTDIENVWSIYKQVDCFVLPSRGEGCGIPYLEAMSCGLPTLYPCRGGQVDYMNDLLCTPINCQLKPVHRFPHNPNYNEKMFWIETDADDLGNKMMNAVVNRDKERDIRGARLFKEQFGYDGSVIKEITKMIEAI